jgi:hypothetical protein
MGEHVALKLIRFSRPVPGEASVSETKRTLKQKAVHEMREYLVMSFYLFVVFSLFVVYKPVILAEHHINFALHGFALFDALALAKVMRRPGAPFGRPVP